MRPDEAAITIRSPDGELFGTLRAMIEIERVRNDYPLGTMVNDRLHVLLDGIEKLLIDEGPRLH